MRFEQIKTWYRSLEPREQSRVIAAAGIACLVAIFVLNTVWSALRSERDPAQQPVVQKTPTDESVQAAIVQGLLEQLRMQQNSTPPVIVQKEKIIQPTVKKEPPAVVKTKTIGSREPVVSAPSPPATPTLLSILQKYRRWRGNIMPQSDNDSRPAAPLELQILKIDANTGSVFLRLKRTDLSGIHTTWEGRINKSGSLIARKTAWSHKANIMRVGAFNAMRPANQLYKLNLEYLNGRLEGGTSRERIVLSTAIVGEDKTMPAVKKETVKKKSSSRKRRTSSSRRRRRGR